MPSPILPKGSKVLVTGVNGFIASHIANQLLEDGYHVRGTVRSEIRGKPLLDYFESRYGEGKFETVIIPDITQKKAFKDALAGTALFTLQRFVKINLN